MKLILNQHLASIGLAFSEAFVFSQRLGFEPRVFVDAFNKTPHKNYFSEIYGPSIANGDYSPLFTVNMLLKDLTLAENQATRQKVALPGGKPGEAALHGQPEPRPGRAEYQFHRPDDAEAQRNQATVAQNPISRRFSGSRRL